MGNIGGTIPSASAVPAPGVPAALLFAACLLLLPSLSRAQAAVLYKDLRFTAHDRAIKGADNYGDLQGPAIENRHFALFVSVMEAHIHADMLGKRMPGLQLHRFSKDINRHGGWDWGEDILKVGTTLAAGTPGLLVNGSIKTFDIALMDSLVISIPDSSAAHPELRVWAYKWRAGLANPVDFHWTLRTRLDDRHMEGSVRISPAAGATIALGVIKAAQAAVRRDSARAQLAMTGLPTYWSDSALLAVRSTAVWFRGFLDQEGSVGLKLAPDAEGMVRWTQGGSWIQEPEPVWRQPAWETTWLPEPTSPGVATATRSAGAQGGQASGSSASRAGSSPGGALTFSPLHLAPGWTYKLRLLNGRLVTDRRR